LAEVVVIENPILNSPYVEPKRHFRFTDDGITDEVVDERRKSSYFIPIPASKKRGKQEVIDTEWTKDRIEENTWINRVRFEVDRWRIGGRAGVTRTTTRLLDYWTDTARENKLFFCQIEAVETAIYIAEVAKKAGDTWIDNDLKRFNEDANPGLFRIALKMATGSGKTVVMAMLIAWAACNRGQNPSDERFPNGVLVCCPNLTVKERLQVLRPDNPKNYYSEFDIVPAKHRPLLAAAKVLITNWHAFAPKSEHSEGDRSFAVVNKGPETSEAFARDRLGELFDRLPIMVLNDEAHHCYRPKPVEEELFGEDVERVNEDIEEATIWIEGLDRINNATNGKLGVAMCIDLSATPFYLAGSGHPEGRPFPWLVSDFGLVDAIESGIVKIPRLPVLDTTGRPDPKYFKLWKAINESLQPGERLPGKAKKPKPEVVYREAEGALRQLAGQWKERFEYIRQAAPGQEHVPPVLIIVCDNTDIAEVFYRKISGESMEEAITEQEVADVLEADEDEGEAVPAAGRAKKKKSKLRTIHGRSEVLAEFANTAQAKHTIRIDTKLLAEAESEEPGKTKSDAAEQLRQVVATVGKPGEPGEHVRCVVSVAMLTEGWDANNVTHILGLRAFQSQLLCEQVVGRGLRRMDYTPDPKTGLLTEEYVDVYGIPFTVIPFKGRETNKPAPEDKPKNHVRAVPEREEMEIRFPVVEGYAFALKKNSITCDVDAMEPLILEPNREPTATFLLPQVGYQEGRPSQVTPFPYVPQDREQYYRENHLQTIEFRIAQMVVDQLVSNDQGDGDTRRKVLRLQSRHQLFPQVYRFVNSYVSRKVDLRGCNPCELGLRKYVERTVERLRDAILPDQWEGEPPLMPLLNRYKPIGSTRDVDFKTTRPCQGTQRSHINQVVLDTETWEASTAFWLEQSREHVKFYARNDHLGLVIPYEYQGLDHGYEPDFLVRLANDLTLILETKGYADDETMAKHNAARRWVTAVNNWGELGPWAFHVCYDPQRLRGELAQFAS